MQAFMGSWLDRRSRDEQRVTGLHLADAPDGPPDGASASRGLFLAVVPDSGLYVSTAEQFVLTHQADNAPAVFRHRNDARVEVGSCWSD